MEAEPRSQSLVDALARGDAGAAAALYADDGRLVASTADLIRGRGEIEAYWRAGLAVGLTRVELEPTETEVVGELAVELGRYAFAADERGERGVYLVLHRREAGGGWRRAVEIYNPEGGR